MLSNKSVRHNASVIHRNNKLFVDPAAAQVEETKTGGASDYVGAMIFSITMERSLDFIEQEFGSASAYLTSIGFGEGEQAQLRELLLEDVDGDGDGAGSASGPRGARL